MTRSRAHVWTAHAQRRLDVAARAVARYAGGHPWPSVLSRAIERWLPQWSVPRRFRAAFILGILLLTGVAWGGLFVSDVISRLPASDEIDTLGAMANATVIYDAFDQPVFTLFRERRLSVPLHDISPHLIAAVIATEDQRFYRHRGFDLIRVGGAALADVAAGRLAQGGARSPNSWRV